MSALVVEDDPVTGSALADLLRRNGWRVEWAATLDCARAKLKVFDPDLVLLDLMLNGENSLPLLEDLARLRPRRVVMLTAAGDGLVEAARAAFGALEVLQKPMDPADLIKAVGLGRKGTLSAAGGRAS